MRDPHQNIFFYYRGPSNKNVDLAYDPQIEDNTTKSFINVLEYFHEIKNELLINLLFNKLGVPKCRILSFALQQGRESSRPDALIILANYNIHIESKVRAALSSDQITRHLSSITLQDYLLVISNNKSDQSCLSCIEDKRLIYLSWGEIHKLCLEILSVLKEDKKQAAVFQLLKHFIDYLEVAVMTEFNGFKDEDFDFWIDKNPYYVPILKRKLEAFAEIIGYILL